SKVGSAGLVPESPEPSTMSVPCMLGWNWQKKSYVPGASFSTPLMLDVVPGRALPLNSGLPCASRATEVTVCASSSRLTNVSDEPGGGSGQDGRVLPADVRLDEAERRYEITADGAVAGFVTFRDHGATRALLHTETDAAYKGRGLASRLIQAALDDVREKGLGL